MLDSLSLLRAMNGIHEEDVVMAGKSYFEHQNMGNKRKLVYISLLAAVLLSLFAAGAYALEFLGMKAIVIPEQAAENSEASVSVSQPQAASEDMGHDKSEKAESRKTLVSITQPQAIPEEMDTEIKEKVENTKKAWAEWRSWRENSPDLPQNPTVFISPKGTVVVNYVENEDGTYSLYFFDKKGLALIHDGEDGDADFSAATPIEVRSATAKEMAEHEAWMEYVNLSYGDYDFNYDIHSETEAAKLEEIAAKYGLRLRRGSTLLWSRETVEESDAEFNAKYGTDNHTDTSDPRFLTNQGLCERISDTACHGPLFKAIPRGFDKVYYFDEGTFCVSYDQELDDGRRVSCYGYNSMYATLSSGREVVSQITDPESFLTRTHTAPDGTELTIMQKHNEAFLYAYLADSFFEMHIQSESALSEADVDVIADNLNYGNIGM